MEDFDFKNQNFCELWYGVGVELGAIVQSKIKLASRTKGSLFYFLQIKITVALSLISLYMRTCFSSQTALYLPR